MRRIRVTAMLGIIAVLFASRVSATTISIDFDSLPTGVINPGAFADLVFTNASVVADDGFNVSTPHSIVSTSGGSIFDQAHAVGVTFNTPASIASIVGVNVGFNGMELDAFDAANHLLDSMVVFGTTVGGTVAPNPPGELFTLSVSAPGIARVAIYQPTTQFFDTAVLDNFSATVGESATATPEPASLALLALGLAGVAMVLRRRHSWRSNAPPLR